MSLAIKVEGTVTLREDYSSERKRVYYAVLDLTFSGGDQRYALTTVQLPIPEDKYRALREETSQSTAEEPVLRVQGTLETILGHFCMN